MVAKDLPRFIRHPEHKRLSLPPARPRWSGAASIQPLDLAYPPKKSAQHIPHILSLEHAESCERGSATTTASTLPRMADEPTDDRTLSKIKIYCFGSGLFILIIFVGMLMQAYYLRDFQNQNELLKKDVDRLDALLQREQSEG